MRLRRGRYSSWLLVLLFGPLDSTIPSWLSDSEGLRAWISNMRLKSCWTNLLACVLSPTREVWSEPGWHCGFRDMSTVLSCPLEWRSFYSVTLTWETWRKRGRGCGSKKTLVMIFSHVGQAPILLTGRLGPVPREDNTPALTVPPSRLLKTRCGAQPWVGKRVIRREFMSRPFYPHILWLQPCPWTSPCLLLLWKPWCSRLSLPLGTEWLIKSVIRRNAVDTEPQNF